MTRMGWARLRRIGCAIVVLGASWSSAPIHGAPAPAAQVQALGPLPMWTRVWQAPVRAAPGGELLSLLDIDQEVRVTGSAVAGGVEWRRVLLWGALTGWIPTSLLAPAPIVLGPWQGGVPVAPSPIGPHAPMPLRARAVTTTFARLRALPDAAAPLRRILRPSTPLAVTRWATDAGGRAWYGITSAKLAGWIYADSVNLLPAGSGHADLAPLRGLGMWCTPAVLHAAPPEALVEAARRNGITHLYIEVASSRSGDLFYGGPLLDALLPLAHRAHIAVLAWVFPFLDDLPLDVATAIEAARYTAPSGDRPDGLAADVEQNMQEPFVRAYSQIVRARLGPHALMVVATYPPQSYWGGRYPFRTVARSWDVIVPMDYWHDSPRAYPASEVYRYVRESIQEIRKAGGGRRVPIEVLGQMFDVYGNGRHSPSAAEIAAAIRAARDEHALGISFFEWNHATPEEWDALRAGPDLRTRG